MSLFLTSSGLTLIPWVDVSFSFTLSHTTHTHENKCNIYATTYIQHIFNIFFKDSNFIHFPSSAPPSLPSPAL